MTKLPKETHTRAERQPGGAGRLFRSDTQTNRSQLQRQAQRALRGGGTFAVLNCFTRQPHADTLTLTPALAQT